MKLGLAAAIKWMFLGIGIYGRGDFDWLTFNCQVTGFKLQKMSGMGGHNLEMNVQVSEDSDIEWMG